MDIGSNSLGIRALGVDGIVVDPQDPMDLIQDLGLLTFCGGRHSILLQSRHAVELIIGEGETVRNSGYYYTITAKLPVNQWFQTNDR